jgi:Raf kinase inhibitor-like YbhB/YbcL family protein
MPVDYTCRGRNISPELRWSGVPAGAESLTLIVDDPDIPMPWLQLMTWTHWVVYDIPRNLRGLTRHIAGPYTRPTGAQQAITSFRKPGYGGPCPPFGTHRYYFRLCALDCKLGLNPSHTQRADVERAMAGHVLDTAVLVGLYR